MAEMEIDRGDHVIAPNGTEIGQVAHVIINEASRQVTDLVVARGGNEFLVPMTNVARRELQRVILREMPAHMATQRPFQPEAYRGVDDAALDASPVPPMPGRPTATHVTNDAVVIDEARTGARPTPPQPPVMRMEHSTGATERVVMPPAPQAARPPVTRMESTPPPAPPRPPSPPQGQSSPANLKDQVVGAVQETVSTAKEQVTGAVQDTVTTTREHLTGSGHEEGGAPRPQQGGGGAVMEKVGPLVGNVQQSGLVETIRQNPLPAALMGLGLGWLWMQSRQGGQPRRAMSASYRSQTWRGPETRGYAYGAGRGYEYGTTRGYAPGDVRGRGTDTTGWQGQGNTASVGDRLGDTAGQTKDAVGDFASGTGEKVGQLAGGARDAVSGFASNAQDTVGGFAGGAQEQAGQLADRAGDTAQQAQTWFSRSLHDAPLSIAALALAGGVAVGLTVPDTEWEDRMIGPARETLRGKAQSAVQDTLQKVQNVASDVQESVTQEVQKQARDIQKQQ